MSWVANVLRMNEPPTPEALAVIAALEPGTVVEVVDWTPEGAA